MKGWLIIVCFIDFARNKNLRSTHIISKCDIHVLHLYVYTCTVPQNMTNSALFPIKFQVRNICFKNLNQLPMQFQSFPVSAFGYMDPGPSLKKLRKPLLSNNLILNCCGDQNIWLLVIKNNFELKVYIFTFDRCRWQKELSKGSKLWDIPI